MSNVTMISYWPTNPETPATAGISSRSHIRHTGGDYGRYLAETQAYVAPGETKRLYGASASVWMVPGSEQ